MSIIYQIKIEICQFFFLLIFTFRFKKKLNNLWKNIIIRLLMRKKMWEFEKFRYSTLWFNFKGIPNNFKL